MNRKKRKQIKMWKRLARRPATNPYWISRLWGTPRTAEETRRLKDTMRDLYRKCVRGGL